MAIKGKKKSQKSRAKRPAAPKPVIVVPKKPVMARRWVQVTAAAVIACLFGLGFGYGFGKQHKVNETVAAKNNAKALVASYKAALDPALKDVGIPDPATGSFKAFTSLATDAASIKKGESGDAGVTKDAASVTTTAKASGGALAGVDIAKLAGSKSVPADVRNALTNSQKRLTQAFALYVHAASDLKDAAASTGAARAKALASAQQLTSLANSLISDGYNDYSAARIGAGLQLDQATKSQLGQQAIPSGFPISSLPS